MNIEDALFWFVFSFALIILGVFPGVIIFLTNLADIQSPVNGLFLIILFIILIRLFSLTLKVSMLTLKLSKLAQEIALDKYRTDNINKKGTESCR